MDEPRSRFTRLFAEGVVIVVSILLAFGIEAWWDERQDRAEEHNILLALQEEFSTNRAALVETIEMQEASERRYRALRDLTTAEIRALPVDSVGALLGSLTAPRTFDAVRGTVDALVGAGALGLLQSNELQRSLTSFLGVLGDADEDAQYMAEFAVRGWEAAIALGGPWNVPVEVSRADRPDFLPTATPDDLAALQADEAIMGLAAQTRLSAWVYVGELKLLLGHVERILELVDQELAR